MRSLPPTTDSKASVKPRRRPSAVRNGAITVYQVKEIFYTLQGEGAHAGRPAVFCRFSSCNLWTGREADRDRAICKFCDTDFVGTDGEGGGKFDRRRCARRRSRGQVADRCRWTPDGRRAPAESHSCSWTMKQSQALQAPRLLRREWRQRNDSSAGRNRLALRQSKGRRRFDRRCGSELKFVFPQGDIDPIGLSKTWTSKASGPAHGRADVVQTPNWPSNFVWSTRNGGSVCRPTSS